MITEQTIIDLRTYLQNKTGIYYFKSIRQVQNNLILTCPFHKGGQENKPSASLSVTSTESVSEGTFHCFTCGKSMPILQLVQEVLGDLYNESEVEDLFGFKTLLMGAVFTKPEQLVSFDIPKKHTYESKLLDKYNYYHEYLLQRGITENTAQVFNIGFDKINKQITFPIRDRERYCIGIGRRSIDKKQYIYPYNMVKPLYGIYELPEKINYLYVVEGPFNLWSLYQWGKSAVALLGTGTPAQYEALTKIKCNGYVLALDPDTAGFTGTDKIIKRLLKSNKKEVYVLLLPIGKDVNDLTQEEFNNLQVIHYTEWLKLNLVN